MKLCKLCLHTTIALITALSVVNAEEVTFTIFSSPTLINKTPFTLADQGDIFFQGGSNDGTWADFGFTVGANTLGSASFFNQFIDNGAPGFDGRLFSAGLPQGTTTYKAPLKFGFNELAGFTRSNEFRGFEDGLQPGNGLPVDVLIFTPEMSDETSGVNMKPDNTFSIVGPWRGEDDGFIVLTSNIAGFYITEGQTAGVDVLTDSSLFGGLEIWGITQQGVNDHLNYIASLAEDGWKQISVNIITFITTPKDGTILRDADGNPVDEMGNIIDEEDGIPFPVLDGFGVYTTVSNDPNSIPTNSNARSVEVPLPHWSILLLGLLLTTLSIILRKNHNH